MFHNQEALVFQRQSIYQKKIALNEKNDDEKFFVWATLDYKFWPKHYERFSTYKNDFDYFNFDNINWPAKENDNTLFETQNENYCLCVYGYDLCTEMYSIYKSLKIVNSLIWLYSNKCIVTFTNKWLWSKHITLPCNWKYKSTYKIGWKC